MLILNKVSVKYYLINNRFYNWLKMSLGAIYLNMFVAIHIVDSIKASKKFYKTFYHLSSKTASKAFIISNKHNTSVHKTSSGFTLPELIVTVCVLAIIATIAAPAIMTQLTKMEAKRIRYAITTTIATAKAESYIRRQNLIVCLADLQGRCNKNNDKAILLFFDINDNKNFDANVDELLDKQRLAPKYSRLQLRAGNRHYIKFWGDSGKPRGFFGHIKYCPTSSYNQTKYQISFNQVGIVKYKPNQAHPTDC